MVDHIQRGLALIIVNKTFDTSIQWKEHEKVRDGAEKDITNMETLFQAFNFQVELEKELTAEKMLSVLRTKASEISLDEFDCFVCVISTHGNELKYTHTNGETTTQHIIYGTDGNFNFTSNFTKLFDDCPGLAGKPKLFFIQACRSFAGQKKEDVGHDVKVVHESKSVTGQNKSEDSTGQESTKVGKDQYKDVSEDGLQESQVQKEVLQEGEDLPKMNDTSHECQQPSSIVCFKDELIMWPVVSGLTAQRCKINGSFMLTFLSEELKKMQSNEPLLDVLTRVSFKIAEDRNGGLYNVVSCINHRLRREIFFSRKQNS